MFFQNTSYSPVFHMLLHNLKQTCGLDAAQFFHVLLIENCYNNMAGNYVSIGQNCQSCCQGSLSVNFVAICMMSNDGQLTPNIYGRD